MAESDFGDQQRSRVTIVRRDTSRIPDEYDMTHPQRGVALVINNKDFTTLGLGCRGGTEGDVDRVGGTLGGLGFQVRRYTNLSKTRMKELMREVSKEDHTDVDCFACVIMTHGEQDIVYGTDGTVDLEDIFQPFKGHLCQTLAGKPKLFFIQACRGKARDFGADVTDAVVTVTGDGGEEEEEEVRYRIPSEADFLLAYSVVPGYFSWRHTIEGSIFINALCDVMDKEGVTLDLMTLMTRVNKMMAYGFEVHEVKSVKNPYIYRMKQMSSVLSMLTRDVYFHPK